MGRGGKRYTAALMKSLKCVPVSLTRVLSPPPPPQDVHEETTQGEKKQETSFHLGKWSDICLL